MIIFITAKPEHPTKQQIIRTLDNSLIPFEVIHPSISWWMLKKKLHQSPNPLCLLAPDHPRVFHLCHYLKLKSYRVINPSKVTLLCRNRISISLQIKELLTQYKLNHPNFPIYIPNPRYFRSLHQLDKILVISDYPIVIKYPVNHSGIHYVNMIHDNDLEKIPRFFNKSGIYIEKYIEAQDILLKCYNFGDTIITQQESNRQSLYQAHNASSEIYTSRKHRNTVNTPHEIEKFTHYIAKKLDMMIFGMDFLITDDNNYWLVDFNDFPGARGIEHAGEIIANHLIQEKKKRESQLNG